MTGTSVGAPHTQPGVPRLRGARTPDVDKVSAGQAGQVGLPEGKPDRCNMDRCPVDPVEGDIPRWILRIKDDC